MLAEIYGWFTEGFDTADLKDAKALLDELGNCDGCAARSAEQRIRAGSKFCARVRHAAVESLPEMRRRESARRKFCADCGMRSGARRPQRLATASRPSVSRSRRASRRRRRKILDGERKTVTALFADIKGSIELMEDLDPEEARAIIDPALKLMIDAVHRYDGYVVQSTGDGIFALFGAPVAHEDHPQRALYAALRMQEDMRRYAERLRGRRASRRCRCGSA